MWQTSNGLTSAAENWYVEGRQGIKRRQLNEEASKGVAEELRRHSGQQGEGGKVYRDDGARLERSDKEAEFYSIQVLIAPDTACITNTCLENCSSLVVAYHVPPSHSA